MPTPNVVVIGDALVDELRTPTGSTSVPGGSALNVATGLAILGIPTTLIAMIGDDSDGALLLDAAARFGVRVLASDAPLGTGRAISDRTHGEPRYEFTDAQVRRSIHYSPTMLEAIADAPLVAISGFPFDNALEFAALADAVRGSTVLIDPNPRPGMLLDRALFATNLDTLAATSAMVKIGEDDAALVYNEPVTSVAANYLASGAGAVLATLGSDGAALHLPASRLEHGIVHDPRPIIDTMGAGDSTFAAVIAGLVSGDGWETILETAMGIAAETIRFEGGQLRVP